MDEVHHANAFDAAAPHEVVWGGRRGWMGEGQISGPQVFRIVSPSAYEQCGVVVRSAFRVG